LTGNVTVRHSTAVDVDLKMSDKCPKFGKKEVTRMYGYVKAQNCLNVLQIGIQLDIN
jgi:hypothetical protein